MRTPPNPLTLMAEAAAAASDVTKRVASLLPRAVELLDAAEQAIDRFDRCVTQVQALIGRVAATERSAGALIDEAAALERRVELVLDDYEPVLRDLRLTARRVGDTVGPAQVDAAVASLDFLPALQRIDQELIPVLVTLRTVGPDLTELLAVSRRLTELMGSGPGPAQRRSGEEVGGGGDS